MLMETLEKLSKDLDYAVGEVWINTDKNIKFTITEIDHSLVTLDDGLRKLSSVEHMNKTLWNHLVGIGVYKKVIL